MNAQAWGTGHHSHKAQTRLIFAFLSYPILPSYSNLTKTSIHTPVPLCLKKNPTQPLAGCLVRNCSFLSDFDITYFLKQGGVAKDQSQKDLLRTLQEMADSHILCEWIWHSSLGKLDSAGSSPDGKIRLCSLVIYFWILSRVPKFWYVPSKCWYVRSGYCLILGILFSSITSFV